MSDELTVGELMDLLEGQPVDAVVRVVHQPSWPLQEVVGGIANSRDLVDDEYDDELADSGDDGSIVFGSRTGRLRRALRTGREGHGTRCGGGDANIQWAPNGRVTDGLQVRGQIRADHLAARTIGQPSTNTQRLQQTLTRGGRMATRSIANIAAR
jgi:hypothetical protein